MTDTTNGNNASGGLTNADVEAKIGKATKDMNTILMGVIIVLFVGFLALLAAISSPIIDAIEFRGSTYQDLSNQVSSQNTQIQVLQNKVDGLSQEICSFEKYRGFPCVSQ